MTTPHMLAVACLHWGLLATQKLEQNHPGRFFDVAYPLPTDLTRGKRRTGSRLIRSRRLECERSQIAAHSLGK